MEVQRNFIPAPGACLLPGALPGHGYIVRNNGFQENSYSGICKRSALPVFNDRFYHQDPGPALAGHLNRLAAFSAPVLRSCRMRARCFPRLFRYFGHAGW